MFLINDGFSMLWPVQTGMRELFCRKLFHFDTIIEPMGKNR